MQQALGRLVRIAERTVEGLGVAGALVTPLLIATVVLNVTLRYGFRMGMIELEELQWHLNAVVLMLGLAYALKHDAHVRVDIWRARMGRRTQALVEILGIVLLLLPFAVGVLWFAWGSFTYSWSIREGSPMPSGLPARYLVRLLVVVGFALLIAQALACLWHAAQVLAGRAEDRA